MAVGANNEEYERSEREKLQGRPENRFRGDRSLFMACLGDGDKEEGFG